MECSKASKYIGTYSHLITLSLLRQVFFLNPYFWCLENRARENASLATNKEQLARSDGWFQSYNPLVHSSQVTWAKKGRIA
jgi:hypothetical protein